MSKNFKNANKALQEKKYEEAIALYLECLVSAEGPLVKEIEKNMVFARKKNERLKIKSKNGDFKKNKLPERSNATSNENIKKKYTYEDIELVRKSEFFNEKWYINTYFSGLRCQNKFDPVVDFLDRCLDELLNPSQEFDTKFYLDTYPDIKKNKLIPLLHFIKHGKQEGRHAKPIPLKEIPDKNGNLRIPNRRLGNQRQFKSISFNREHYWYLNKSVRDYISNTKSQDVLPGSVRRILVIAHYFEMSTGVARPISHYLNAMCQLGGYELTSIEMVKGADGQSVAIDIDAHDFVIVNSYAPFINNPGLLTLAAKTVVSNPDKLAIYLHETDFGFDKFEADYPELYAEFCDCANQFNFFLVSNMQAEIIKRRFGGRKFYIVRNTTKIESFKKAQSRSVLSKFPRNSDRIRIVMVGTLQPRKGVNLFSDVADYAADNGLNWEFVWAGTATDTSVRKSNNVNYLGYLDENDLSCLLESSDLFFLSSVDDPFPLSVLEAIQLKKRVVVFKDTGIYEVIHGVSGTGIYSTHSVGAAVGAIKKALNETIDIVRYEGINQMLGLEAYVNRMNAAISNVQSNAPVPKRNINKKIAVHLHLYYLDLWLEMRSYLNNLNRLNVDIYITISKDALKNEVENISSQINFLFPNCHILYCENRGMDVGSFFEVISYIYNSGKTYDYLLKIHTKKSLQASGKKKGAEWRRELLEGLLGSQSTVDRIISLFESDPSIGMIGPKNMIISKTKRDVALGANANLQNIKLLANKFGLAIKDEQRFVRGTMFWSRFNEIVKPIVDSGLSIKDFESGHQLDMTKAHAMERLLPAIIEKKGLSLHAFDNELPRSIVSLKGLHADEDVYVIAAGASCDYINPSFFDGKIVVGINRVFRKFRCDYVVMKEYGGAAWVEDLDKRKTTAIISKWDSGNIKQGKQRLNANYFRGENCFFYEHLENTREAVDLSVIDEDSGKLVVSYSSITTALHFAAYLGAKNIILVGHDCGTLDGKEVFNGYNDQHPITPWKQPGDYRHWLRNIEGQSVSVRDKLNATFGTNVVSLNPFLNFGLEGHVYIR